jgi:hypothetical protein
MSKPLAYFIYPVFGQYWSYFLVIFQAIIIANVLFPHYLALVGWVVLLEFFRVVSLSHQF